jgi:ERCC4-type nuclease
MTIYVDTREQLPFSLTEAWDGVEVERITMETADYTNDNGLLLERKSVPDICNCCGKAKKRFMREVERGFHYLIIEGSQSDIAKHLKYRRSRMTPQYIMSVLKRLHSHYGIEVIMCKDREEAAAIALYILQNGEL